MVTPIKSQPMDTLIIRDSVFEDGYIPPQKGENHLVYIQGQGLRIVRFGDTEPQPLNAAPVYSGEGSFQPVGPDLVITPGAGAALPDTDFLAAVMGNILSESAQDASRDGNYLAGVIGAYSIPGTIKTDFGTAGLMGIIMDGAGKPDAVVLAVIDGDSAKVEARAAFGVKSNNSNPDQGVDYGLDLYDPAHDGFDAFAVKVADIRFNDSAVMMVGTADPSAGGGVAAPLNSLYRRTNGAAGELWYKVGAADVNWTKII